MSPLGEFHRMTTRLFFNGGNVTKSNPTGNKMTYDAGRNKAKALRAKWKAKRKNAPSL